MTTSGGCARIQGRSKAIQMKDGYLTKCVVDPVKRTVYLYSSEGTEKKVSCETVEEFMNVLNFVRSTVDEETLSYVPL